MSFEMSLFIMCFIVPIIMGSVAIIMYIVRDEFNRPNQTTKDAISELEFGKATEFKNIDKLMEDLND